jgi:hypothetical protein
MVTFKDGTTTLGSAPLDATAHATISTASLAKGNHVITASYAGDGNFTGSNSIVYGQTITGSAATLRLADVLPGAVSAAPATSGKSAITPATVHGVLANSDSATSHVDAFFALASRLNRRISRAASLHMLIAGDDDASAIS